MITIRLMREDERVQVSLFIRNIMRTHYHCDPHSLPQSVFIALNGDELVGTMALIMSEGEPFPLESIYKLDYRTFPESFDRTRVVQFGRWIATQPKISELVAYAAMRYALSEGKRWGIGEVKPKIARRYAQIGLDIIPLGGIPHIENVPEEVRAYYFEPPQPMPCALSLFAAVARLREKVVPFEARQGLAIMHH